MMSRTVTTYPKHFVEVSVRYSCKCGHTFYRKNRDWFTVSPLNTVGYRTSRSKIKEEQSKRVRDCPKCGTAVKPTVL